MNGLDILFLVILGYTLLRGLYRGFIQEIISIIALLVGFCLANIYYPLLMEYIEKISFLAQYSAIISYVLVFLTVVFFIIILGVVLQKFTKMVMLNWLNRLCGGAFGLVKGTLICSLILFLLTMFLSANSDLLSRSKFSPYVHVFSKELYQYIPESIQEKFREKSEELQKKWNEDLANRVKS